MIDIKFDASAINASLDRFSEKIKSTVIRTGAQAAAQVFYEETKQRVPVETGRLKSSIYQVFSKDNSGDGVAVYHISWNRRKAPHGHLVEFGTSKSAARPFLRPAFESVKESAVDAAKDTMARELK